MKILRANWLIFILAVTATVLTQAPSAMAAMTAEARANADGLYINYDLGALGSNELTLTPGDEPVTIPLGRVATLQLSVLEIRSTPAAVIVHYVLASPFLTGGKPIENNASVPFGDYGAAIDFLKRVFPLPAGHDLEACLLLTRWRTQYDVTAALEPLLSGHWAGTATPADNVIQEQVLNPIDNSVWIDINLELRYLSLYITEVTYTITLYKPLPGAATVSGVTGEAPPLTGKFPVPNGSYHFWADIDASSIPLP